MMLVVTDDDIKRIGLEMERILHPVYEKLDSFEKKFEQIDKRFEQLDKKFEQIDRKFAEVFSRLDALTLDVYNLQVDVGILNDKLSFYMEKTDHRLAILERKLLN